MRKSAMKIKDFAIFAAIALTLLPATINAQNDTYFHGSFDEYNDRDASYFNGVWNEPFGIAPIPFNSILQGNTQTPLGSGLLIMLTAGAGYAVARSRRKFRKASTLLVALAVMLGFTQCGKQNLDSVLTYGENVNIILNAGGGHGGKHIIEPGSIYVPITYEAGDVLYVSNGGKYAGKLICSATDGPFTGTINVTDPDDDLYFYFVGGLKTEDLENDTRSFTVDICNQKDQLPVLSMGQAVYVPGETEYNCKLCNKCALVEFDFTESTNKIAKISNMLCEAKIDFTNNTITPTEKLDAVTLYSVSGTEKWAILLLSDVERKSMGMVYNRTEYYSYTGPEVEIGIYDYYDGVSVPALSCNNNFLYGDNAISVDNSANNKNNRVFVVSANGNAVRFAPGNLMYRKSTGEWSFMEHQYDVVETTSVEVGEDYALQDVVDHFGWGCTGFQDSQYGILQNYYMPYSTNHTNSNAYYGPTGSHGLSVMNKSDWGAVANDANLGGHDDWRLLTKDECDYLLKYRLNALGKSASAQIYKPNIDPYYQNGMMFFPEDWINDGTINTNVTAWNNNKFDDFTALATFLESNGAIYLPAAGYHEVTSGKMKVKSINSGGYYWLSTYYSNVAACCWYISGSSGIDVKFKARSLGYSVRLAR
jgi:ABC-type sugar transport system, permease component